MRGKEIKLVSEKKKIYFLLGNLMGML